MAKVDTARLKEMETIQEDILKVVKKIDENKKKQEARSTDA
jgi:hypothetical protein